MQPLLELWVHREGEVDDWSRNCWRISEVARPHEPRRPCGRALCIVQDFSLAFSWTGTRAEART